MVILFVVLFLACMVALFIMQKKKVSFNALVIVGLVGGIAFGALMRLLGDSNSTMQAMRVIGIVGNIYVRLLKMMVIPLIFVSIVCAVINQKAGKGLGKMTAIVLAVLLGTAAIAAVVGGGTAMAFGLNADGLEIGEKESMRGESLTEKAENMVPFEETLVNIVPDNPVYALTGQGSNATLSVVAFAALLGIAIRGVATYEEEHAENIKKLLNSLNTVIVELVMMILMLTPYGVFSLMSKTIVTSDFASIARLAKFVGTSYVAIIIMFVIHGIILALFRMSPFTFFKKALPTLTFAFTSRTSAGTLPLTTRTLTDEMGVESGTANLASSLAISIGQNGCAAIYPAMLVVMIMPTVGMTMNLKFFITMILVITITSIGIAGVGGGATFAGIAVLSALGLPVGLAGLLVAVEPLIDMARTALNVSDGMVAALVTGKITNNIDMKLYNSKSKETNKTAA